MARALYIHWPFCLKKCPYCDFNSHVRDAVDIDLWQEALLDDMRFEAQRAGGEALTSVFFGGGTPSLMPPALVARLLEEAEKLWGLAGNVEITLEANPSSVEADNFADLARAGIGRVSLGLQSLKDESLRFLGRLHSASEGLAALATAQEHFDRVSFDLIYALPGQSERAWRDELARAIALGTSHLSLYQLTIEPGTRFASQVRRGEFAPLDDDRASALYAITAAMTSDAALPAYETSNHARTGEESRHNLTYWRYQDYCGIGPGAHGRRGGRAIQRHKKPENYLSAWRAAGNTIKEERALGTYEQASEALLMGLRLKEGIDLHALAQRFGLRPDEMIDPARAQKLAALGMVWQEGGRIGVSEKAMVLLDAILAELVSETLVSA